MWYVYGRLTGVVPPTPQPPNPPTIKSTPPKTKKTKTKKVAVVREGRLLLDIAAGVRGAADPRPVHNDTLFPILDLGA